MGIILVIALAKLFFHCYFNNRYGYFRDEFDYMACGDHLAWGYVVFRILHSMIQCTSNIVRLRFPLFGLASFCLLGLTVHAGARILHDCLGS